MYMGLFSPVPALFSSISSLPWAIPEEKKKRNKRMCILLKAASLYIHSSVHPNPKQGSIPLVKGEKFGIHPGLITMLTHSSLEPF